MTSPPPAAPSASAADGRVAAQRRARQRALATRRAKAEARAQRRRELAREAELARWAAAMLQREVVPRPGDAVSILGGTTPAAATVGERHSATPALAIILGLAGIGLVVIAVSLLPQRIYLGASRSARLRPLADFSFQLASSRGEVALFGLSVLAALAAALLIVYVAP